MSTLTDLSTALADAVDSVAPAIVRVEARRRYGATGLAWRSDGYILTSDHVVERDEDITVVIPGSGEKPATLVGRDRVTDIALLKIDEQIDQVIQPIDYPVRPGNLVLALGAQPGEHPVVSFGVVAMIHRPWRSRSGREIENLIRSDVTLYPGFSGGPLIDVSGQVVGLNTSALTRGLAATLPWELVEQVGSALAERGTISSGYLGVVAQPVKIPASLQASIKGDQASGLLISAVESNSPAESAGVLIGDILIGFDDRAIIRIEDLQAVLGPGSAGNVANLRVIRGGNAIDVGVTIGER
jgi:S1-C subfamily serine protease